MNTFNDINENESPESSAPHLSKVSGQNPFRSGTDYFDGFLDKVLNRVDEFEELKTEAPLLSNTPKYNPFDVPVSYFEDLPTLVQQKVASKPKTTFAEWFALLIKPRFAFPVLTVLVIAFTGMYYMGSQGKITPAVAEELNVDEQLQNIDETTMIEALTAEAMDEPATVADPEKDSIREYLLDNNIDELNLNTEL